MASAVERPIILVPSTCFMCIPSTGITEKILYFYFYFTLLDMAVVRLFAFQPVVSRRCSCFNIVAQVTL